MKLTGALEAGLGAEFAAVLDVVRVNLGVCAVPADDCCGGALRVVNWAKASPDARIMPARQYKKRDERRIKNSLYFASL